MTPSPRMHPSSKPMTCKIAENLREEISLNQPLRTL